MEQTHQPSSEQMTRLSPEQEHCKICPRTRNASGTKEVHYHTAYQVMRPNKNISQLILRGLILEKLG
jgi:hypothetical protein